MNDIEVVTPSFRHNLTQSYYLSGRLSTTGLSFCVLDPVSNTYVAYGLMNLEKPDSHFARQEELLLTHEIFTHEYKEVAFSIDTERFTLVPQMLYDERHNDEIMHFIGFDVRADEMTLHNEIELSGATLLFAIPQFLYYFILSKWPEAKIFHTAMPTIQSILMKRTETEVTNVVNACFKKNALLLTATEKNTLKLCNEYQCRETNDYVYMLMNAIEQLGFKVDETQIILEGNLQRDDEREMLIERFAKHVRRATLPQFFNYAFTMPHEAYRLSNLFTTAICV